MHALARLAVRRPVAVSVVAAALVLLGWTSWSNLPLDLLPDLESPTIVVSSRPAMCATIASAASTMSRRNSRSGRIKRPCKRQYLVLQDRLESILGNEIDGTPKCLAKLALHPP